MRTAGRRALPAARIALHGVHAAAVVVVLLAIAALVAGCAAEAVSQGMPRKILDLAFVAWTRLAEAGCREVAGAAQPQDQRLCYVFLCTSTAGKDYTAYGAYLLLEASKTALVQYYKGCCLRNRFTEIR